MVALLRWAALCCALGLSAPSLALDSGGALTATPLLKTSQTWAGQPLVYPPGEPEITAVLIELAVGGETGWHRHPVASYAYVLQGQLEVRLRDGRAQRVQAGEVLAEVVGLPHNGRNVGTEPVKLVVFYTGAVGGALTHAESAE